jgi:hypothetical protein
LDRSRPFPRLPPPPDAPSPVSTRAAYHARDQPAPQAGTAASRLVRSSVAQTRKSDPQRGPRLQYAISKDLSVSSLVPLRTRSL